MSIQEMLSELEKSVPEEILRSQYSNSISKAIAMALIRSYNLQELLEAFDYQCLQSAAVRSTIFESLAHFCEIDKSNIELVRTIYFNLLNNETKIRTDRKRVLDNNLYYLTQYITEEERISFAIKSLEYRRASRRKIGLKIIREGFSPQYKPLLIEYFKQSGDKTALTSLTRVDCEITDVAELLFSNIDDNYELARVFEKLISQDFHIALKYATQYPIGFVWGAGRTGNDKCLPTIIKILNEKQKDYRNLSLIIWALGKFQAKDELQQLACEFKVSLLELSK